MTIKAKSSAVILPKTLLHYVPDSFDEHKDPRFIEATSEQVLSMIQPISFDFLPGHKIIAIDTETFYTGVPNNRMPHNVVRRWIQQKQKYFPNDFPFCISISDGTHSFVVYDTLDNGFKEFKKLMPLLCDTSIDKVGHNMSYDLHMLANARIDMKGRFYDTMHLSKLTRAHAFTHNLFDIANEICDVEHPSVTKFERMVNSYKGEYRITDYRQIPKELMTQYTCADTWNTIWAFKRLYPIMVENKQERLFDIESEVMLICYYMERLGICIDPAYGPILIPELEDEVNEAERAIYDTAGTVFNINSTQQLYGVLCDLGYGHLVKRRKPTEKMLANGITTGNPKLDKYEMERLDNEGVPLIADIVKFRQAEKLLNTFARKLYEMRDFHNVVHCNINTIEAKTGRFSISAPSMQNMPRRTDSRVRTAFIAPPGFTLYDFDFKAQESLIMSHYSRAPYLLDIINKGGDIHRAVAAVIYSVPMEEVDKALRDIAKSVEFAIVYGAGPSKVSAMTGLTLDDARAAMNSFKRNVPEVDIFIRTANQVMQERGLIRTVLNRHVYAERGREYACVNYLCQGCQPGENMVLTTTGYVPLAQLTNQDKILTLSGPTSDYAVYPVGPKSLWKLRTTHHEIEASPDHRFGVYHEGEIQFIKMADLKIKEHIYVPLIAIPEAMPDKYSIHYLLGYALGDGTPKGHYITLCGGKEKLDILSILQDEYTEYAEIKESKNSAGTSYTLNIARGDVVGQLRTYGLEDNTAADKKLPDFYLTAPVEYKVEVLKGLWDSDGGYSGQTATYTTTSAELAKGIHRLMNSIGILTKLRHHTQYSGSVWRVSVDTASFVDFSRVIGARRPAAIDWLNAKLLTTLRSKEGVPPQLAIDCFNMIYPTEYYSSLSRADKSAVLRFKHGSASRTSLMTHLSRAGLVATSQFELLCKGTFSRVVSIKDLHSKRSMFDITIHGNDHSYIAEGLANHNSAADSTKSRMIDIYKFLKANGYKTRMILQVHDSLLNQVADDEADFILGYLRWLQTERDLFRVTVSVDVARCHPTWREKQDIDVPAVKPPEEQLERMRSYNIWEEGILGQ